MGVSGLLPLLKSIQVNKHLSEFAGQTLAVDAYVWLHRGVYSCAPELATGKKTTKYVDYAMHRVRLLQHHHIQPYVVFDGGPLPAKKGTETERKQKRAHNLARANTLAAQGKFSQAREYYVKCVDVTPQMAYQFIKALRAESVPYIVAPYEADAQLAYLEKIGLVDGIITEDSDLLIFGCCNVLFKLDAVANAAVLISRSDFASVTSDGCLPFLGWSDAQFRAMAILSGCDYLESVGGVGLKTAWTLLKKHRTVENVVKVLRREGKKNVPRKYLEEFKLAEKVFLYQRVYDPIQEKLVCLTEVPVEEPWDEVVEAYVGSDLAPVLAKQLAQGELDPITLSPMEDINPDYIPRRHKSLNFQDFNRTDEAKGKLKAASSTIMANGILNFFARVPKATTTQSPKRSGSSQHIRTISNVGRDSGKRTLTDVMEHDLDVKRKKVDEQQNVNPVKAVHSRFFAIDTTVTSLDCDRADRHKTPIAGPSKIWPESTKENVPPFQEEEIVLKANHPCNPSLQDGGHISRCVVREDDDDDDDADAPDFSSPIRPRHDGHDVDDGDFDAEPVSSPPLNRSNCPNRGCHQSSKLQGGDSSNSRERMLAQPNPVRTYQPLRRETSTKASGPDLHNIFSGEATSEIDCSEDEGGSINYPGNDGRVRHSITPDCPHHSRRVGKESDDAMIDRVNEVEQLMLPAGAVQGRAVSLGWSERWAFRGNGRFRRSGALKACAKDVSKIRQDSNPRSTRPRSTKKGTPLRLDARVQSGSTSVILGQQLKAPLRLR